MEVNPWTNKHTKMLHPCECCQLTCPTPRQHTSIMVNTMHMPSSVTIGHPCILGAPIGSYTPIPPDPSNNIQLLQFTYGHNRFPNNAIRVKSNKYNPLIQSLKNASWNANPFITITARVHGVIHEQSIDRNLEKLYTPKRSKKNQWNAYTKSP